MVDDEGWMRCECEYCSLEGDPRCPSRQTVEKRDDRISSLLMALQKSPCKYSETADIKTIKGFLQRYNRWVDEVRNPVYENDSEDWLKVARALSDLHALRCVAKNLKAFEDVDLYGGEKITVLVKKLDGTVQELEGDWLARTAQAEVGDDGKKRF